VRSAAQGSPAPSRWKATRDRTLRRLLPSTALLTQSRVTALSLDALGTALALPFPEFRELPPNRLRVRVGVSNRVLANHSQFVAYGAQSCIHIFARGYARHDSHILDLGCGCGRVALCLKWSGTFDGLYTGTDVDREMIDWCDTHLADKHFRFVHADVYSGIYNPTGDRAPYTLPVGDGSQDLVMSESLFTHLLDTDVVRYVKESFRVLRPGGRMLMTVFCLEDIASRQELGGRWTFRSRRGNAYVENETYPEAAVAYERNFLVRTASEAGFSEASVTPGEGQSAFLCSK
jgi:SAM-dependent methyltransferase